MPQTWFPVRQPWETEGARLPWESDPYSPSNLEMFLGAAESEAIDKLPKHLVAYLLDEAEDPAFVTDYLIPALRTSNPHETIMSDMAREAMRYQLAEYGVGSFELYEMGLGKSFFKKIGKVIRKVTAPIHRIEKKIVRGVEKVWHKYGNIILTVVGGVMSIFVGPAAMAAASVLIAANTMYQKKKAADAAKKAAKQDAAQQMAAADATTAQVAAQVEQFYQQNTQWFLDHGITPDKWASLTLDQKIDIINAGAKGTLPVGIGPTVDPSTSQPITAPGTSPGTGPPAGGGGGGPAPGGYAPGGGGGGGGEPSYGPPPGGETGGAPTAEAFNVLVEGKQIGTFGTLEAAAKAALDATKTGDRFEVIANGRSTGLRVRTSSGSIDVPPDMEAQVRAMSHEKMMEFVAQAEKDTKGGIPWGWIILAAGGAAKITGII
jgi:hypothetical protein